MKVSIAAGQFRLIERIIGLYPFGFNHAPVSFNGWLPGVVRRIGKIYNAVEDLVLGKHRRRLCHALGVTAPQGALFAYLYYNIGCRLYPLLFPTPIYGGENL